MKAWIFLVLLWLWCAPSWGFEVDWTKIHPRVSASSVTTKIDMVTIEDHAKFLGLGASLIYDIDENAYVGLGYDFYKNSSPMSFSNIRLIGGFNIPYQWQGIKPFVEFSLGWGFMEEQGNVYKVSDSRGRVYTLMLGGLYNLKEIGSGWEHWSVLLGYEIFQQTHATGDSAVNFRSDTQFQSHGPRLGISYNF